MGYLLVGIELKMQLPFEGNMPGCWNLPAHVFSIVFPFLILWYTDTGYRTWVERRRLNMDMGTCHMALVSLVQRISAVSDSNLAGGD